MSTAQVPPLSHRTMLKCCRLLEEVCFPCYESCDRLCALQEREWRSLCKEDIFVLLKSQGERGRGEGEGRAGMEGGKEGRRERGGKEGGREGRRGEERREGEWEEEKKQVRNKSKRYWKQHT